MTQLAISNIAWNDTTLSPRVYELMQQNGFTGLETAPGKITPGKELSELRVGDIDNWIAKLGKYGINPVAMQSLFYGTQGMNIFNIDSHESIFQHFNQLCGIAQDANTPYLIFGAPKNRLIPTGMSQADSDKIAENFFRKLGDIAGTYGVFICVEPVSSGYGGNFLTNTLQTYNFVKQVGSRNILLHLDIGTIMMENEGTNTFPRELFVDIAHTHISRPNLGVVKTITETDKRVIALLNDVGYVGALSIEIGPQPDGVQIIQTLQGAMSEVKKLLQ